MSRNACVLNHNAIGTKTNVMKNLITRPTAFDPSLASSCRAARESQHRGAPGVLAQVLLVPFWPSG